ncbi:hypothetical protein LEMLEM_LOCUS4529, partial [Lemmus lemmus]
MSPWMEDRDMSASILGAATSRVASILGLPGEDAPKEGILNLGILNLLSLVATSFSAWGRSSCSLSPGA